MKPIEWWNRTVITMVIHSFWLSPPPPVVPKNLKKTNNALLFTMFIWTKWLRQISSDCAQTQHETAWCWRMTLCKIILNKLLTEFRFVSIKWYMPLGGVFFFSTNIESIGDINTTATLQTKSMKGIQTPPKTEANVAYLQRCLSRAINTS